MKNAFEKKTTRKRSPEKEACQKERSSFQADFYPQGSEEIFHLEKLFLEEKRPLSERMSTRLVKCASVLKAGEFVGWQMVVPRKGLCHISLFASHGLGEGDLAWLSEKAGQGTKKKGREEMEKDLSLLYELSLPVTHQRGPSSIGFGSVVGEGKKTEEGGTLWPGHFSTQFGELVRILRKTGAALRCTLGPAGEREKLLCKKNLLMTMGGMNVQDYLGTPVVMRVLLLLSQEPSLRLKTVLNQALPEARLDFVGGMDQARAQDMWDQPLVGAATLPDLAARVLMMEPTLSEAIVGMDLCEEGMKGIPATHKNTKDKRAVCIGQALDVTGIHRKITIGEMDLRRHYQIVGQTGTGKSTLLAGMILSAIEKGYGLTFFDPHGSTIDTVLHALPAEKAEKVRVVRIGDAQNPVPLNIWDSDDPTKEERNISDLCELFNDIFDPFREGVVGPHYERWLTTFAKASIALLGRRASLESIAVVSKSRFNMRMLYDQIKGRYPEIAEVIQEEYGKDEGPEFENSVNWYLCKFQKLTAVEQLRKTLGAGANALDFPHTIDTDTVTLIDLAVPTIGTNAARIVGTLVMMKLWKAALERQKREKTHLVLVDEASLFQTNPMPRMLSEARKFGLAMVLCHQHTGQLVGEIRDALEANSASFSTFRLSPKDAVKAAVRFDEPEMISSLTRLDAFNAMTSLSVDGRQTEAFTLQTIPVKPQKNGDEIAAWVEERSRQTLVEPYRSNAALTPQEVEDWLMGIWNFEDLSYFSDFDL